MGLGWDRRHQFWLALLLLLPIVANAFVHPDVRCKQEPNTQTLAPCHYDDNCMDNAFCEWQVGCKCKEGFLVHRSGSQVKCLKIATKMGDACEVDVQCSARFTAEAMCRNNRCQCTQGAHYEEKENRCYKTAGLGELCQTNYNCHVEGSNSFCESGYCSCPLQHHPSSDMRHCLRSAYLNDTCDTDEQCKTDNTKCFGVCRCQVDHVLSWDGTKCLKASALGEPCEVDSQCQVFRFYAVCDRQSGSCGCSKNYHRRGPVCVINACLLQSCENHRQCITKSNVNSNTTEVTNVDCVNRRCVCAKDYTITEDGLDCIRYSESGASGATTCWMFYLMPMIMYIYYYP